MLSKNLRPALLLLLLAAGCLGQANAQQPVKESPLQVNPCVGVATAKLLSQEQKASQVMLAIEIDSQCEGVCIGSVEYDVIFTDSNNREVRWHKNKTWDWRSGTEPFVLNVEFKTNPNYTLKEVRELGIGRCSCSILQS